VLLYLAATSQVVDVRLHHILCSTFACLCSPRHILSEGHDNCCQIHAFRGGTTNDLLQAFDARLNIALHRFNGSFVLLNLAGLCRGHQGGVLLELINVHPDSGHVICCASTRFRSQSDVSSQFCDSLSKISMVGKNVFAEPLFQAIDASIHLKCRRPSRLRGHGQLKLQSFNLCFAPPHLLSHLVVK